MAKNPKPLEKTREDLSESQRRKVGEVERGIDPQSLRKARGELEKHGAGDRCSQSGEG